MIDQNSHAQLKSQRTKAFFPDFRSLKINTSGSTINLLVGGEGPPLLLLHGYPQTHMTWRKIAPVLANDYTVVVPDLRGYGDSGKPDGGENHINYSKRAMALDQIEVMGKLGYTKFAVVGHDRGGRVGHRLALDHPDRITKLMMIDIVPTEYMYRTADRQFATGYYHWFFLIQPAPLPEKLIGSNADTFLKSGMGPFVPDIIEPEVFAEYLRCFNDPAAVHAACEDYRAGATIDIDHDLADMDRKISCPVSAVWGGKGLVGKMYDVLSIWRERADNVTGKALPSNHWVPEEAPKELLEEIKRFLAA